MLTNRFELFSILGFRVSLDLSWVFLAVLVTWSLATGYFPQAVPGVDPAAAWWLGAVGALGLFASIILHELSHSYVARQFGIPIHGITLFIFGGVAEMEDEPPSARSEFYMAIAGPIMSYVLAGLFYLLAVLLASQHLMSALFGYLALINAVLATFNLVPAFPLDGGRVFRAAMWWWTGDYVRATRTGATLGRLFGIFLIAYGVMNLIAGFSVIGIWQALLGLFIVAASRSSEMQLTLKTGLEKVTVGQIMVRDLVSIPADMPLDAVVEEYFYRHHHKAFPVLRDGTLLGCIRIEDVGRIPREDRAQATAVSVIDDGRPVGMVTPQTPVIDALKEMNLRQSSRLLVTENGRLRGMLTMRDIMNFLTIRKELRDIP
ncbi:site-2 protease family protein [Marimonas arenosa]|uniref:Zinc metalloprotease n=1 Tax=Marimonas arenosa TaxID=1795305 RepID=A0AAE3W9T4_9RHOB|nr:site-2 protease family protein [Marimonas arenosa]MDQ2088767.1 site-2 protease family protein [Marimonas arenosa]